MRRNLYKYCIFVCLICLSAFFVVNLNSSTINYVSANIAVENCCYDIDNEIDSTQQYNLDVSNESFTDISYKSYTKGMNVVNVLFNFVNYEGDSSNHFTLQEITDTMSTFTDEVNFYFERMSQGYVSINLDYVCTISSDSYDYYAELSSANYYIENTMFTNAVNAKLDYDGSVKDFKFSEYNFKVNAFAGNSGDWNTFLWPHAYSSNNLILMMEYQQSSPMSSRTLCHEMMHTFGVGDLYAYTGSSQYFSAQYLDIMATSFKNTSVNAYFRNKVGWIESSLYNDEKITQIEEIPFNLKESFTFNLYPNCTDDYTKTIAYKFGENSENGEFFIMEYRIKNYASNFDSALPNTGVVIYRVNPSVRGNSSGNEANSLNEIIFMGDSSYDISTYSYTKTCLLTEGSTYGNKGDVTSTSLVYSSAGGKENLFNGTNSNIIITINSLSDEYASITIDIEKEDLDLSNAKWDYSSPFTYTGTLYSVQLINVPTAITITYDDKYSAINVGKYTTTIILTYDEDRYNLINDTLSRSLTWEIIPTEIIIKINNKSSLYGDELSVLTYNIIGNVYNDDNLNISLTKEYGTSVGCYTISGNANNSNYNISIINALYTINHRVIEIEVLNQTFTDYEFKGLDQTKFNILDSSDEILEDDVVNITLNTLNFNTPKQGDYTITASIDNNNYKLIVNQGILHITSSIDNNSTSNNKTDNAITILWISITITAEITIIAVITSLIIRHKRLNRWRKY